MLATLFQAWYELMFNTFTALPNSDMFIAKRIQCDRMQWILFDAYKFNFDYDINIIERGFIQEKKTENGTCDSINLNVNGDFSSIRRSNLHGIVLNCGFVVSILLISCSLYQFLNVTSFH